MASVVLGTAVQNNPELQARLYGAGAMNVLLTTLAHEVDARAMSKHIFALSALVRGHNDALKVFGGGEGLKSLRSLNSDQMDGDRRTRDSLEVRVVRLVEDVLNPELHPDFADSAAAVAGSFAANTEVWCRELDARLSQALVSEEPEAAQALYERPTAYAHALGLLCSQYPDNCMLSQSLQRLARDKIARLIDSEDVAASYRQALADILN
ncbi:nucleotide exchange factor sil1 [Coemansia thaxteri]|nr:nucleotide exchange factor sil1 [Coemansia thaxteri]KAJ2470379.1 nucleotide exchange factor sil1 [Coemansia sp. RSA 2322]